MQKQIVLEEFRGPLELLLQLVRRSEIPIEQLTLQNVIAQLMTAIDQEDPRLDEHTESLAPAASLLLLKSRWLLPVEQEEGNGEVISSSPEELMRHVVDYCHFREAAEQMAAREKEQSRRYGRLAEDKLPPPPKGPGVEHIGLSDLVEIVQNALRRAVKSKPAVIEEEEWRVADAIESVRAELRSDSEIPFTYYFNAQRARGEMIVFFLAILEMMKIHELRVDEGVLVAV